MYLFTVIAYLPFLRDFTDQVFFWKQNSLKTVLVPADYTFIHSTHLLGLQIY